MDIIIHYSHHLLYIQQQWSTSNTKSISPKKKPKNHISSPSSNKPLKLSKSNNRN